MKKTLCIIFLLFLVACGSQESKNASLSAEVKNNIDTQSGEIKLTEEELKEKKMNLFIERLPENEQTLFYAYDEANSKGDKVKEQEFLFQIKELEEEKRIKLDNAVKSGDIEGAKQIRKELMIFTQIRR